MQSGFRFRLYPTPEQASSLLRWIGCQRFIYNAKVSEDRYFRAFARKSLQHAGQFAPQDQQYSHFITETTPWLREVRTQNFLSINPTDADPRGIRNGDRIMIRSAAGQVEGVAQLTQAIRPGVVGADGRPDLKSPQSFQRKPCSRPFLASKKAMTAARSSARRMP